MFYYSECRTYAKPITCGLKKSTTLAPSYAKPRAALPTKRRKDVEMGELFSVNGDTSRVWLHSGKRTVPPSDSRACARTYGYVNGKPVIGFQSLLIKGQAQDDGAFYTTNGDQQVTIVGKARIIPTYH